MLKKSCFMLLIFALLTISMLNYHKTHVEQVGLRLFHYQRINVLFYKQNVLISNENTKRYAVLGIPLSTPIGI
jgi:hypothetical protein